MWKVERSGVGILICLAINLWPLNTAQAKGAPAGLTVESVQPQRLIASPNARSFKTNIRLRVERGWTLRSLRVFEARNDKRSGEFGQAFSLSAVTLKTAAGIEIPVSVDLTVARFPGRYTVKAKAWLIADQAPQTAKSGNPTKTEAPKETALTVTLLFERLPAKLADISQLFWAFDAASERFVGDPRVTLTESSSDAYAVFDKSIIAQDLRGPNNEPVGARSYSPAMVYSKAPDSSR